MNRALYKGHDVGMELKARPRDGHGGLWYDRFFHQYDPTWKVESAEAKLAWINTVKGKCGDAAAIDRHVAAQKRLVDALKGERREFATDWNFATGLGNPHPVENGFLWHPALGTPYIAGSAVKGLVRAWIEGGWSEAFPEDGAERRKHLHRWFGSESKDPMDCKTHPTQAGGLIFFDAIPVEPPTLGADVMTPHMGKWYELGSDIKDIDKDSDKIPADWHDPVPVPFLVVTKARFLFAIAPRAEDSVAEVQPAMEALDKALAFLGAGAKTAVGYGCMKSGSPDTVTRATREWWQDAKLGWNKGSSDLTASRDKNVVSTRGNQAKEIFGKLPESVRSALEERRLVYADVEVEREGNSLKLISVRARTSST